MKNMNNLAAIIIAILGSGGISAVITSILSARKYQAEASSVEQQTEQNRRLLEQEITERLSQRFVELADRYKLEYEEQLQRTKTLEKQVAQLNKKYNQIVSWIMTDNASYINYLETELAKYNPSFTIPKGKGIPDWIRSLDLSTDDSAVTE